MACYFRRLGPSRLLKRPSSTRMVDIVRAGQHKRTLAAVIGEICDLHLCAADVAPLHDCVAGMSQVGAET
jgi:hypothetical protein